MFFNGLGGFTPDGHEYVVTIAAGIGDAGALGERAREPRVRHASSPRAARPTAGPRTPTSSGSRPWTNDPVTDAGGEAFYIRDEESGRFWSPTSAAGRQRKPVYEPARVRLQRVRAHGRRHHLGAVGLRGPDGAGEVVGAQGPECVRTAAPPVRHRLRGVGARRPPREGRSARDHLDRCGDGRRVRREHLQRRIRRRARRSSTSTKRAAASRATARSSSAATAR